MTRNEYSFKYKNFNVKKKSYDFIFNFLCFFLLSFYLSKIKNEDYITKINFI